MQLLDLPAPEVLELFSFETIKARKLARVIEIMKAKDIAYVPSESDDLMTMIEADAYDEMLMRTRINNAVKSQLLAFAKKADLDHLGTSRYGVPRLKGSRPYALFSFALSAARTTSTTLLNGLKLGDGKAAIALLLADVVIPAGSLSATGMVELQEFTESSVLKTESILTPLPYVASTTQSEAFHSGADAEDDDKYRERIWLSREMKSTAGSMLTYKYFAKTADARISEVELIDDEAGVVKVYLLSNTGAADQVMIDRVNAVLSKEEIRPLTDDVQVSSATIVDVILTAEIVLYDLTYEAGVRALIEAAVAENTMIFGRSLSLSKIYGLLESEQVKDVILTAPVDPVTLLKNEVINISALNLTFTGAAT